MDMSGMLKGTITVIVSAILIVVTVVLINLITGSHIPVLWLALGATFFGIAYGLQAGILGIYELSDFKGWLELVVDATWSLPNTLFGFIVGNIFYPFFGDLSKSQSNNSGWIVYMRRSKGKINQTLGTINIGGAGQHERMHLFQSRLFGPLYLLLFALNYIINFLIQVIWTFTIGGLLWLLNQRSKAYFRPSSHSVVQGFFGWIYYATLFELWAYGSGNPK